jgi:hypothetical protein
LSTRQKTLPQSAGKLLMVWSLFHHHRPNLMMNKNAQLQTADQTLKGAVLALGSYIAHKNNVDPQIIALSVPVAAGVMAWVSTLIGNKNTACLFVDKDPNKK